MRTLKSDDRGATAIFLALVLVLLLGVAAIAVDLAQGWNERRQDQTAADVAAVAGALSYDTNQTTIADQVMDTARLNLDTTYFDSDWDALWTACAGPPPAGFLPITHSTMGTLQCIGINPSYFWVRLPDQIVETSFGKAIGVDSLTTNAEATVTLLGGNGGGALPFPIRGNAGSGEVCLDTGPNPEAPCDGNESGSFGNIAPPLSGTGSSIPLRAAVTSRAPITTSPSRSPWGSTTSCGVSARPTGPQQAGMPTTTPATTPSATIPIPNSTSASTPGDRWPNQPTGSRSTPSTSTPATPPKTTSPKGS